MLPSGERFDVASASARKTAEVASQIAATTRAGRKRGRRANADAREVGRTLEGKLIAAGLRDARVRVLAGKTGKAARLRIDGVPVDELPKLCHRLAPAGRPRSTPGSENTSPERHGRQTSVPPIPGVGSPTRRAGRKP